MANLPNRIARLERQAEAEEATVTAALREIFDAGELIMTPNGVTAGPHTPPAFGEVAAAMSVDLAANPRLLLILLTAAEIRQALRGDDSPGLLAAVDSACRVAAGQIGEEYSPAARADWLGHFARIKAVTL